MSAWSKWADKLKRKLPRNSKLSSKTTMFAAVVSVVTITTTLGVLFYCEIRKNKNSTKPLGYRKIDRSKIPQIKDRTAKDIVKDRYHPSKTKVPKNIDFIVIGSGIGGLSAAACLSRCGRRVLVLEQHDRIGGCLHQYSGKFQFDTGIHYIGKPNKYLSWLKPITSKKKPIQFVAMGTAENGYVFDEYLIGKDENCKTFKARAFTRREDLLKQFPSEKDKKMIDKFYKLNNDANYVQAIIFVSKCIPNRWFTKLLFKFGKWKFPELWNKSAKDIFDDVFAQNKLLGMAMLANIGDFGGTLKSNAMALIYGLFAHYKEGGYFINGGPSEITRSIMPIIEESGGRCLANMEVKNIIFENDRAVGVVVKPKKSSNEIEFRCKSGVISAAGFRNTYTKLAPIEKLPKSVPNDTKLDIQRLLDTVEPSAQHLHVFIGFNKTWKELDFPQHNRWYMQFEGDEKTMDYDYDKFITEFHKNPLTAPIMGFLSFPSAKNPDYARERPGKATAILITEIPRYHFEKWKNEKHDARGDDYDSLKKQLADRLMNELLFKYYPKCKNAIAKIEIGTALSAEYYIASPFGESYGLSHSCERYFDYEFNQLLSPKQPIRGLYLAGQDLVSCGFSSAFQGGLFAAEAILGYHKLTVIASGRSLIKDLNKMDGIYKREIKPMENYDYNNIANQQQSQNE